MAWTGVWSIKVDGTELNNFTTFITQVPELEQVPPVRNILAQRDGDYPVFIRSQPAEAPYTFLIAMVGASTDALYHARWAALQALFTQGRYHTLVAQVRGMPSTQTLRFIVEQGMPDYKQRIAVFNVTAPKPVLA